MAKGLSTWLTIEIWVLKHINKCELRWMLIIKYTQCSKKDGWSVYNNFNKTQKIRKWYDQFLVKHCKNMEIQTKLLISRQLTENTAVNQRLPRLSSIQDYAVVQVIMHRAHAADTRWSSWQCKKLTEHKEKQFYLFD